MRCGQYNWSGAAVFRVILSARSSNSSPVASKSVVPTCPVVYDNQALLGLAILVLYLFALLRFGLSLAFSMFLPPSPGMQEDYFLSAWCPDWQKLNPEVGTSFHPFPLAGMACLLWGPLVPSPLLTSQFF